MPIPANYRPPTRPTRKPAASKSAKVPAARPADTVAVPAPRPVLVPSAHQEAIYDFVRHGEGHGVVNAVAGSGKTHTIVEASRLITRGEGVFFAFNVHIKDEIKSRLGPGSRMTAMTVHAYGFRALRNAFAGLTGRPNDRKYHRLAENWVLDNLEPSLAANSWQTEVKQVIRDRANALFKLVNMARLTLTEPMDFAGLADLMWRFDIATESPESDRLVRSGVAKVLDRGVRDIDREKVFDYTDMIWVPVAHRLPVEQFDTVFVDECQDLSNTTRTLVRRACKEGGRMLLVGDERQAIMGFAGADAHSYRAIKEETQAKELPLSVCYRCSSLHLDLARKLVPHIEDRPNAPQGEVHMIKEGALAERLTALVAGAQSPKDGPLVLCRMTAPLVSACIDLIKKRVPAKVRGRDVAKGLIDIVRKIAEGDGDPARFLEHLAAYEQGMRERMARADNAEALIEALGDKCDAIRTCFVEFAPKVVLDLCAEIEAIFDDGRAAVWLSTIHRAKGLEADHVHIIRPQLLPMRRKRQSAEEFQQELNLFYVALTRAKKSLTVVYDDKDYVPSSFEDLMDLWLGFTVPEEAEEEEEEEEEEVCLTA